jgi:4-hydroxy-tetrahydrodipicolinate synthase
MRADQNHLAGRRGFLGSLAGAAMASALASRGAAAAADPQTQPAKKAKEPFRGIFTIPCSTFNEDGEVDLPSCRRQIDFCVECGAHGLVFPVNASEWTSLTDDERIQMDKVLVEKNAGRVPVVIGIAAATVQGAVKFGAHAREIGADAVIALPPRVGDPTILFNYYRRISESARVPVFIQDHEAPVGTPMSPDFLLRLCRELEYVKYVKEESNGAGMKMTAILKGGSGVCKGVFGGSGGRYLVDEYRRGCSGQMPGCHVTDVEVAFWNALEKGDEARYMHIYKELAPLFFFESQFSAYKEVLYRRGVISCAMRRNAADRIDEISSKNLDMILKDLQPLMTWRKA